jgi:hypothetical protein
MPSAAADASRRNDENSNLNDTVVPQISELEIKHPEL